MARKFREWTLAELDKTFHLRQIRTCPVLEHWLTSNAEISEVEKHVLVAFREILVRNVLCQRQGLVFPGIAGKRICNQ